MNILKHIILPLIIGIMFAIAGFFIGRAQSETLPASIFKAPVATAPGYILRWIYGSCNRYFDNGTFIENVTDHYPTAADCHLIPAGGPNTNGYVWIASRSNAACFASLDNGKLVAVKGINMQQCNSLRAQEIMTSREKIKPTTPSASPAKTPTPTSTTPATKTQ